MFALVSAIFFHFAEIYFCGSMSGMDTKHEIAARKAEPWRLKLKEAIDERRWDYKHLSEKAGFNDAYISKMLNGRINPTVDKIMKICEVAEISMASIFAESEKEANVDKVATKTINLTDEEAVLVARLLESVKP